MNGSWEAICPGFVAEMSPSATRRGGEVPACGALLREALDAYGVVVLRDAEFGPAEFESLARVLGDPEPVTGRFTPHRDSAFVQIVTTDGEEATLPDSQRWHVDRTFDEDPPRYTMLQGEVLPLAGGNTDFADMFAAYERMPAPWREALEGAIGQHHFLRARDNPVYHPVVRVCPRTGRRSLYVSPSFLKDIRAVDGGPVSVPLDDLHSWATQDEFTYSHQWRPGDIVVWDNTKVMHRATPLEPGMHRVMHRITVLER